MRLLFLASVLTLAATATIASVDARADQDTLAKIVGVWKERENRTKQLLFTWTESVTQPRGSVMDQSIPRNFNPKGLIIPSQDETYESVYRVRLAGPAMEYHYRGKIWSSETGQAHDQEYYCVFDGAENRIFWPKGIKRYPSGVIRPERTNINVHNIHTQPLLLTYRITDQQSPFKDLSRFVMRSAGAVGYPANLAVLEQVGNNGSSVVLHVAVNEGCTVRRYEVLSRGQTTMVLTMDYVNDAKDGWIPSAWRGALMKPGGGLNEAFVAQATKWVFNSPQAIGEVVLDYPSGTYVVDDKSRARFIQRDREERRLITPAESNVPYEVLLATSTGEATRKPHWIWTGTVAGLAMVTLAIWAWRWRRRIAFKGGPS